MDKIQLILIISSVLFILFIFELTRKNKLRIQYSLIWFFSGFVLLIFSVFRKLLDVLAAFVGVYYAPSLIIPLIIFLSLLIGIHFSVVVSKLTDENKKLIQEVGLLKNRIETLEKEKKTLEE